MKLKTFVEDIKGYMTTYANTKKIEIKKINNKNQLIIHYMGCAYRSELLVEQIPLNEVRLAFMVNVNDDSVNEYFRYEK